MPISPPQPDAFIAARLERLRAAMAGQKLPALLVTSFTDVSYLTGFEGEDSFALVTPEKVILISDARYEEQISREAPWSSTLIRQKSIMEETAKLLKRLKIACLGVQSESLTLHQRGTLLAYFMPQSRLKLKAAHELVVQLRHIKDAHEVEIIEEAIAIAEHGFEALKAHLKVGLSENEIASLLVHEMRKRGASGASFDTIVAAGPNASLPHYRPGQSKLQNNTPLLIDWGARCRGYVSDLTRVVFVGSIPRQIKEIYQIVLDAQVAAIEAIKPGRRAADIDRIARDIITKAGYGKQFGHGLGHGIGRDIHESIAFSRLSKIRLQPGMVLTVEPGIYLPGLGGVRIEDDILVTDTGYRLLSHLRKDLDSAKI